MSSHHLRKDNTCQNCGHSVEVRFCTNCGQENVETRQSFGHLVRHFVEDFTHYDGSFWRTIKYLFTRPALLTKEYLAGRRMAFLPPVRLYIFISFVAFFVPHLMPEPSIRGNGHGPAAEHHAPSVMDTIRPELQIRFPSALRSYEAYDSAQQRLPASERDGALERWTAHKQIDLVQYPSEQLAEKFLAAFGHNLPKALFLYLPLFAFVIWLWHGKKRWLYFDHGIFTLHYFSFILLGHMCVSILLRLFDYFITPLNTQAGVGMGSAIYGLFIAWVLYYFYRGHRKMYGETWGTSFLKSTVILAINIALFGVLLLGLSVFTIFTLH